MFYGGEKTRREVFGSSIALAATGLIAAPGHAWAQGEDFGSTDQFKGRMTVPVSIAGGRPLRFMVDCAANSSVIAADLLTQTPHVDAGDVTMHTLIGAEVTPSIVVSDLRSGGLAVARTRLAVGTREGLDGLDGLIGSELLNDKRILLNFGTRPQMRIQHASSMGVGRRGRLGPATLLVAPTNRRFRDLVMIEALVGAAPARAVIDSGADISIINRAAARTGRVQRLTTLSGQTNANVRSPTGRSVTAELALLPALNFNGFGVYRLPVLVGDFHVFERWGLSEQPAALLGVDVLSLFEMVAIDLHRREFSVQVGQRSSPITAL